MKSCLTLLWSGDWSKDSQHPFPHKLSYNLKTLMFFSSEPGVDQSRQPLLSCALLTCSHFIGVVLPFPLHTLDMSSPKWKKFLFFSSSLLPCFTLLSYFTYDVSHLSVLNSQFFSSCNLPICWVNKTCLIIPSNHNSLLLVFNKNSLFDFNFHLTYTFHHLIDHFNLIICIFASTETPPWNNLREKAHAVIALQ